MERTLEENRREYRYVCAKVDAHLKSCRENKSDCSCMTSGHCRNMRRWYKRIDELVAEQKSFI